MWSYKRLRISVTMTEDEFLLLDTADQSKLFVYIEWTNTYPLLTSNHLVHLAYSYCRSNIKKSDFYLHCEHFNAVKSLRNYGNIIISKLNKWQIFLTTPPNLQSSVYCWWIWQEQCIQHELLQSLYSTAPADWTKWNRVHVF